MISEWITTNELMEMLGVSKSTILTYLCRAEFEKYVRVGGGRNQTYPTYFYKCVTSIQLLCKIFEKSKRLNIHEIKKEIYNYEQKRSNQNCRKSD